MRISIQTDGRAISLVDKTDFSMEVSELTQAVFYDRPTTPVFHSGLIPINSSVTVRNLYGQPELKQELLGDILQGPSKYHVYFLWNGLKASQPMEFVYSNRLMAWEIGPRVEFACGMGACVEPAKLEHMRGWAELLDILTALEYLGGVVLSLNEDSFADIHFGFTPWVWSMYAELCKGESKAMIEWMVGVGELEFQLHTLAGSLLISNPPFPYGKAQESPTVPPNVHRHFWRILAPGGSHGLVSARDTQLNGLRNKLRRSAETARKYSEFLQYRPDLGWGMRFGLAESLGASGKGNKQASKRPADKQAEKTGTQGNEKLGNKE